jgi:hypothetical protein
MAIYVLLTGELPPRHLPDIAPKSSVVEVKGAIRAAFKESPEPAYRVSYDGVDLADDTARLADYDVPEEALLTAEHMTGAA